MRTQLPSVFLATALACVFFAAPANAQAPRTFVSAAGSDSNSCTFAAPCRHFQAAVNATSAGGEVDALDPAGYGPIIIHQAITIEGQGWSYIAPPESGNGITINAVSGDVTIHGVSLNGVGIAGVTHGIVFNSGGSLNVRDSVIRNFSLDGIDFFPTSSTPSELFVSDTLVSDNGQEGIYMDITGTGAAIGVIDHVKMQNNGDDGLAVRAVSAATDVSVSDSVSAKNRSDGIASISFGAVTNVMVRNSTIAFNANNGLSASNNANLTLRDHAIDDHGQRDWMVRWLRRRVVKLRRQQHRRQ